MRVVKPFTAFIAILIATLAIVVVAVWLGGAPVVGWLIEHPISAGIGRKITLGGPLELQWGLITHLVARNVEVANASWSKKPMMFSAKTLEIDFSPSSLLHGAPHITRLDLEGANLLLETAKDGARNWDFLLSGAAPKTRRQMPRLDHLAVSDSSYAFYNGETDAEANLGIARLAVDDPEPSQPVSTGLRGTFQKQPVAFDGKLGPLADLRGSTKPYPVQIELRVGQNQGRIEGTMQKPLDFSGLDLRVSLEGANFDNLPELLGIPLPALPNFRGTSKLRGGAGRYTLDALSLALGQSDLEGGIEIDTTGKVPYLRANLTSRYLDLADFKGLYGGTPSDSAATASVSGSSANGRIIPDKKIEIGKLPGINADLTFDGTRVSSLGGTKLDRVSLTVQLLNGALTIAPLRFQTADGDVDLNLGFSPFTRETPPRLHGEIEVSHVDLHKLLNDPQKPLMVRQTAGIVGGFAKIDTTGASPHEFLAAMSGDAGLFMQNGQLSELLQDLADLDVLEAIGLIATGDKPIPIACMVARLDIKKGVATPTTFLLNTTDTLVSGSGTIDFSTENLDLTLEPRQKSFTLLTLRSPLKIEGTFAQPKYSVEKGPLLTRLGKALGLGLLFPPAALLPLIDRGLGENNACAKTYAAQKPAPPLKGGPTQ